MEDDWGGPGRPFSSGDPFGGFYVSGREGSTLNYYLFNPLHGNAAGSARLFLAPRAQVHQLECFSSKYRGFKIAASKAG